MELVSTVQPTSPPPTGVQARTLTWATGKSVNEANVSWTLAEIGRLSFHNHRGNITSGTLGVARGGTGDQL